MRKIGVAISSIFGTAFIVCLLLYGHGLRTPDSTEPGVQHVLVFGMFVFTILGGMGYVLYLRSRPEKSGGWAGSKYSRTQLIASLIGLLGVLGVIAFTIDESLAALRSGGAVPFGVILQRAVIFGIIGVLSTQEAIKQLRLRRKDGV